VCLVSPLLKELKLERPSSAASHRVAMGSGGSVPRGEEFPEPEALKREEYVTEHHKPFADDTYWLCLKMVGKAIQNGRLMG